MKRTLLISNSCFSDIESNGRTLKMLFKGDDKSKLAQFFTYGSPDMNYCESYYRVRDVDALRSMIPGRANDGTVTTNIQNASNEQSPKPAKEKRNKTPLKMCIREMVWKLGRWRNKYFWNWIDSFNPEIIVVFVANNIFLIDTAMAVAKKKNIPIILYTTEGYNFMDYNYFTWRPSVAYKLFFYKLSKTYHKLAKYVRAGYFNVPLLAEEYHEAYGYPCYTVMNSSDIDYIEKVQCSDDPNIMYAGNLGLDRHIPLIEIADALQNINKNYKIDVYGAAPNKQVEELLVNNPGINYHGFVDYTMVREAISKSDLLVHAEHSTPELDRYLKYAFSTKIADSLSSGTPFFIYGIKDIACVNFCLKEKCAFVANNRLELEHILNRALQSKDGRARVLSEAKRVVASYMQGNADFIKELNN